MLSDETFPVELYDEQYSPNPNTDTLASAGTLETSASTSAYSSESNFNSSSATFENSAKSFTNGSSIQSDSHYASFDASNKKLTLLPPRAPVKKKKSYSCQDLMSSKKNYDHVESKVKIAPKKNFNFPLIDNKSDYKRSKFLSLFNSVSTHLTDKSCLRVLYSQILIYSTLNFLG